MRLRKSVCAVVVGTFVPFIVTAVARADTMPASGDLVSSYEAVITGAGTPNPPNPTPTFTADVWESVFSSAGFQTTYGVTVAPADNVFAFVINNVSIIPPTDILQSLDVTSGNAVDAIGEITNTGGVLFGNSGTGSIHAHYTSAPGVPEGGHSEVLWFAAPGPLVFQNASVQDSSIGSGLVISDGSSAVPGSPLPLPSPAWGGLLLLGLFAGARLTKGSVRKLA